MKKLILFILAATLSTLIIGCTAKKELTKEYIYETQTDTLTKVDTVKIIIELPPDTVKVQGDSILPTQDNLNNFKNKSLNLGPWLAHSDRSWAMAGIINNVPYLNLYDLELKEFKDVPVKNTIVNNKVKESTTESKTIVKYKPWFQDVWFYISIVLGILLVGVILIYIRFRK